MTEYDKLFKYPSTHYHPLTPGRDPFDKVLDTTSFFEKKLIVITEKMDGENATLYRHWYHARSLDSVHHVSRDWIKAYWATICHDIPEGWRICGENLFAKHSIFYENLKSYFYGFSVWDDNNVALSWRDTVDMFELMNIQPVPVLYEGVYSEDAIHQVWKSLDLEKQEGIVIRLADPFHYKHFSKSLCKLVRPNHVQTSEHWMKQEVIPNKLEEFKEDA